MKERETRWEKYVVFEKTIPPREAEYVDFPDELLDEIKDYFRNKDIKQLYCHQAEMFRAAMDKKNVVITTSTHRVRGCFWGICWMGCRFRGSIPGLRGL